jgi:hypothetical protein
MLAHALFIAVEKGRQRGDEQQRGDVESSHDAKSRRKDQQERGGKRASEEKQRIAPVEQRSVLRHETIVRQRTDINKAGTPPGLPRWWRERTQAYE